MDSFQSQIAVPAASLHHSHLQPELQTTQKTSRVYSGQSAGWLQSDAFHTSGLVHSRVLIPALRGIQSPWHTSLQAQVGGCTVVLIMCHVQAHAGCPELNKTFGTMLLHAQ